MQFACISSVSPIPPCSGPQRLKDRSEHAEPNSFSEEIHHISVVRSESPLFRNEPSHLFVEASCLSTPTSSGRENVWGERPSLHINDSVIVFKLLLPLYFFFENVQIYSCLLILNLIGIEDFEVVVAPS